MKTLDKGWILISFWSYLSLNNVIHHIWVRRQIHEDFQSLNLKQPEQLLHMAHIFMLRFKDYFILIAFNNLFMGSERAQALKLQTCKASLLTTSKDSKRVTDSFSKC